MKAVILTTISLLAFAGNSILCRMALGEQEIDAASFTSIRLLSGIISLVLLYKLLNPGDKKIAKGSWYASVMLFIYAVTFSYAYIILDTGIGALILFTSVQITMILANFISGVKVRFIEWIGITTAFSGFMYLVAPTLSTPSLNGFILMAVSGIAWGMYTLAGKESTNPLSDTMCNFIRTLPFLITLTVLTIESSHLSLKGIFLAVLAGALTSGIGYTLWYIALGRLSAVQAAVVQLLVPVMAAAGGTLLIDEAVSMRLVLSSIIILGGIFTVISGKQYAENLGKQKDNTNEHLRSQE
ncbi:DMT family transporter [Thalassotalea sp. G20_0]|uniref:DMT family transporter n=1 Tax=Thalassotalea sp. G20_0 TaxID=2821093 RepID=UPI001ADB252C|nr:DMT family transporter [Thalassotalea sp. G20_0]MBO9495500.1 DMT family transporter [Thalassotalea sp. G20_0]